MHFGVYFASMGGTVAKIRAKMFVCWLRNRFYGIFRSFLSTFVVILRLSYVPVPRYGLKRCFGDFETGFATFAVLF